MLNLRPAVSADAPLILQYIRELAEYEREPDAVTATEEDLQRHLFSEHPFVRVTLAEWNGEPAGSALWFLNFSTWEGKPGIYLEDLYVRPAYRGHGIGKALLKHLAATAVNEGWTRFAWQCLDWNTPALDFYEAHGAKILRPWLNCRVEGEALHRLAEGVD
jgi:GNAT superfamily N-acetyltransferase